MYRDKKVVGVFVRFRAPLQHHRSLNVLKASTPHNPAMVRVDFTFRLMILLPEREQCANGCFQLWGPRFALELQ
jgi:hypothetical protein